MDTVGAATGLASRGLDTLRDGRSLAVSVYSGVCSVPVSLVTRARQIGELLDRLGDVMDDLTELVATTKRITEQLDVLAETALVLGDNAGEISRDTVAIAGALDHVERLAAFVDRIPGGRRRSPTAALGARQVAPSRVTSVPLRR